MEWVPQGPARTSWLRWALSLASGGGLPAGWGAGAAETDQWSGGTLLSRQRPLCYCRRGYQVIPTSRVLPQAAGSGVQEGPPPDSELNPEPDAPPLPLPLRVVQNSPEGVLATSEANWVGTREMPGLGIGAHQPRVLPATGRGARWGRAAGAGAPSSAGPVNELHESPEKNIVTVRT